MIYHSVKLVNLQKQKDSPIKNRGLFLFTTNIGGDAENRNYQWQMVASIYHVVHCSRIHIGTQNLKCKRSDTVSRIFGQEYFSWSVTQVPRCISSISHNATFLTEMCTCVHISVTKLCVVVYLSNVLWDLRDRSIAWVHRIRRPHSNNNVRINVFQSSMRMNLNYLRHLEIHWGPISSF